MILLSIILMPILEIYLLVQMVETFGFFPTLLFCIVSAALGWLVLSGTSRNALFAAQASLMKMKTPQNAMLDTILVFLGGVLLLVPGPISTLIGLMLVFPLTRPLFRNRLKKWGGSRRIFFYSAGGSTEFNSESHSPFSEPGPQNLRDVIEVKHVELPTGDGENQDSTED